MGKNLLSAYTTQVAGGSKMDFSIKELIRFNCNFENIKIDFGNIDPPGIINGLIGLDLQEKFHAVIDIYVPVVYLKD